MKQSRFLTKTDVGNGILVTIKSLHQEDLAMEGEPEQLEWCVVFAETEKPLVLKSVNAQLIAAALKSNETDDWIGKQIVIYTDPTITMKGKVVGGIRCRAPRTQSKPATAPAKSSFVPGPAAAQPARRPAPAPEPAYEPADQDGHNVEEDSPF